MSDQSSEEVSIENNVDEAGSKTAAVTPEEPSDAPPDYVLQSLVDLINRSGLEMGITLTVAGFSISGTLVSGKNFFDGLADEMATVFDEPSPKKAIHDYFANFGDMYRDIAKDEDQTLPIYIHLKDARHFHNSGKPIPGNRGVYWRGRISQISGFSMGSLSAE